MLNIMAQQVPLEPPWLAECAAELDPRTLATWLRDNVASAGARQMVELGVQAVFSAEARDLSLLHFLFYVHSAGSLLDLLSVTGGAQESRFVHGAQSVTNAVAAEVGERVILSAPVQAIVQDERGVQ